VTPDLLGLLATELLDCACNALEATTCGCPCHAFVSVGVVAFDHCCDEGQLWVGIDRIYAYGQFPAPAGVTTCAPPLAADLTIGILRCAPTMNDQGEPPSVEALSRSATQIYEDAYAVINGVMCCLAPHARARPFVIGNQRSLGPAGGCVGSELKLTVALTDPPPGCEGDC
jgi:hypothetical protein